MLVLTWNMALATCRDSTLHETSGPKSWWLPQAVSSFGQTVDNLFYFILYLTVAINIAVFVVMAIFQVRYRYKAGRHAKFIHGNNRLETVWTLIPTLILASIGHAFSESTWSEVKNPGPFHQDGQTIELEVVAQQFQWNFHYPGKDGKLGVRRPELINKASADFAEQIGLDRSGDGKDDIVSPRLVVPVNRKVYIHLTSLDVIHGFYLPNFRIKQDAVPGLNARVWFVAEKTSAEVVGTNADGSPKPFDIACAELCGQGHFKMRGQLFVVSEADYQKFLDDESKLLQSNTDSGY